ncbi:conserved hypothetical protein [Clostridium neonatale]|uniref:DUF4393 domain-containing protein n=1 Tax=Clostridium neonatale TaxID=137838 RepID=UPI00291B4CCE|nr:conserved hypothetical protein [Clostridium neonatale]
MSEELVEKAIIEATKGQAGKIYDDGLKPAIQEIGGALGTVFGLVNNVIFYPLKLANVTLKYKYEQFILDMESRANKIPEDKITEPPLNIVGPTMEALKYTIDTEELREMYLNLLSSSMNMDSVEYSHPAYVEIIKQLTPLDANIFKKITSISKNIPCARISIGFGNQVYINAMPKFFAPTILNSYDPFIVSTSIQNLCRLGLITHMDNSIIDYDYDSFKKHPFVVQQFEMLKDINKGVDLNINVNGEVLILNDFGKNFAKVCL